MTETPADPFDEFATPAEVLAFVYAQLGDEALCQVLEQVIGGVNDMRGVDKESLERAAEEWAEPGLGIPAAIVAEAAATAPESVCPFPEDSANAKDFNRRHHQDFTGFLNDEYDRSYKVAALLNK